MVGVPNKKPHDVPHRGLCIDDFLLLSLSSRGKAGRPRIFKDALYFFFRQSVAFDARRSVNGADDVQAVEPFLDRGWDWNPADDGGKRVDARQEPDNLWR